MAMMLIPLAIVAPIALTCLIGWALLLQRDLDDPPEDIERQPRLRLSERILLRWNPVLRLTGPRRTGPRSRSYRAHPSL